MKLHIDDHIIVKRSADRKDIEADIDYYLVNLKERILSQIESGEAGKVC